MTYPFEQDRQAGSGITINGVAGENVGNRKLVYLDSNGRWQIAHASTSTEMPVFGLTLHSATSGKKCEILLKGFVGLSTWTWTTGGRLYASEGSAGDLTQTSPSEPEEFIQELGFPISATQIYFSPRQVLGKSGATYVRTISTSADQLGRPAANSPTIIDQGNLTLYRFTVDTDFMTYKFPIPSDYASEGIKFRGIWTNDGGVDDQNKNVKMQLDYQITIEGDTINGSHPNSPRDVTDAYTSASGWIEHATGWITIPGADFAGKECMYIKLSFVTAPATVLTCEPHLIGICRQYIAYAYA